MYIYCLGQGWAERLRCMHVHVNDERQGSGKCLPTLQCVFKMLTSNGDLKGRGAWCFEAYEMALDTPLLLSTLKDCFYVASWSKLLICRHSRSQYLSWIIQCRQVEVSPPFLQVCNDLEFVEREYCATPFRVMKALALWRY